MVESATKLLQAIPAGDLNKVISDLATALQGNAPSIRTLISAGNTFSFGWGNIVPRKANKHFSVPVEIGFAYVGYPNVDLNFIGTTCNAFGTACQDVSNNPGSPLTPGEAA